jgi:hypothetical protein
MAEHGVSNTVANSAAGFVVADGLTRSDFARSLMSASFDQISSGAFYWQFSDILTLVCSAIVIANYVGPRINRARKKRNTG